LLLGGAAGLGGILQGLHWKSTSDPKGFEELETQLRIATEENEMLKRENASLRSLAQGGGELPVPREAIDRAEKEFGLRFLSSPVVHRIASEELRERIAASLESRFGPSGMDDRENAWRLIGWLRPDDELLAQLTVVRAVGARGWFDDVTGEAWVTDRFDPEAIPDQAALLRLVSRILLHQHFPPQVTYPGDDSARAREALHQGAAAGAETRFLAMSARAIGFMPMQDNGEAEQIFNSLPGFIQGITLFPVMEGKGYADTLHVSGNEALHKALRNPPQTTRAIIFPAGGAAAPPAMVLASLPEEPYLTDSAGQLGLRLWLEALGDAGAALEISSAWKNDRYALIPDGEASTAVIWEVEMDSKDAADRFQAAALEFVAAKNAEQETSPSEKRHLHISRPGPGRVRFLNTATAESLDQLK
jgi:hypothetical protein